MQELKQDLSTKTEKVRGRKRRGGSAFAAIVVLLVILAVIFLIAGMVGMAYIRPMSSPIQTSVTNWVYLLFCHIV